MTTQLKVSLKLLLPLLAAVLAISPLAVDMYLPAMPALAEHLNTPMSMIQNSLSVYLLGYALGLILFGPMADKYSRRKLVILGIGGFVICSLLLPMVSNIEQFLTVRFMQAFISSAATVVVPGAVREYYGKDTAKGLSYVSMIMMLAPMVAPGIGSVLLLTHSWQLIFYVLAAYSFIVLLLVMKYLPDAGSIASVGAEKKTIKVKVQLSFIHRYKIVLGNVEARLDIITSMMISLAFFAYITAIPYVYLKVFAVSEYSFSLLFALNIFALMIAHFTNTRFVVHKGSRTMLRCGLSLAVFAATALALVNVLQLPLVYTVVAIFPLMGSISLIAVNSDALILTKFPEHSGTVTAVIGTLRWGIGALAGPILAFFYDGSAKPFALLMLFAVLVVLCCQLIVWFNNKSKSTKINSAL
ncbi:MFS transporter [Colwellia sp. MT41]|uniref:Bcr/CflA family efflux transporter n=1 Tax=Colwellia marinimaniae TaxID=1513592 RepID=A0ABQ0MXQ1_9GAMM|nr:MULTISPECIES: multidrug effflux MFS transporter [Colwellia]ALO36101.1 MFS transporter [Colwellia sp. MT41]GAW97049.1 Bcr/CflA family drug resistance efflux transporter [Colwellia marinimaniae]